MLYHSGITMNYKLAKFGLHRQQKEIGAKKEEKPGHTKTARQRSHTSDRPRSTDPIPSDATVEHPESDTMLQPEIQFTSRA